MSYHRETRYNAKGEYVGVDCVIRPDAVRHMGRMIVPTTDATRWVATWEEFREAGGQVCFEDDQSRLELTLPAPYKFGIRFNYRED